MASPVDARQHEIHREPEAAANSRPKRWDPVSVVARPRSMRWRTHGPCRRKRQRQGRSRHRGRGRRPADTFPAMTASAGSTTRRGPGCGGRGGRCRGRRCTGTDGNRSMLASQSPTQQGRGRRGRRRRRRGGGRDRRCGERRSRGWSRGRSGARAACEHPDRTSTHGGRGRVHRPGQRPLEETPAHPPFSRRGRRFRSRDARALECGHAPLRRQPDRGPQGRRRPHGQQRLRHPQQGDR